MALGDESGMDEAWRLLIERSQQEAADANAAVEDARSFFDQVDTKALGEDQHAAGKFGAALNALLSDDAPEEGSLPAEVKYVAAEWLLHNISVVQAGVALEYPAVSSWMNGRVLQERVDTYLAIYVGEQSNTPEQPALEA